MDPAFVFSIKTLTPVHFLSLVQISEYIFCTIHQTVLMLGLPTGINARLILLRPGTGVSAWMLTGISARLIVG